MQGLPPLAGSRPRATGAPITSPIGELAAAQRLARDLATASGLVLVGGGSVLTTMVVGSATSPNRVM